MKISIGKETIKLFISKEGFFNDNGNYEKFSNYKLTDEEIEFIIKMLVSSKKGRRSKNNILTDNKHIELRNVYERLKYLKCRYLSLFSRERNVFNNKFDNFVEWWCDSERDANGCLVCHYCGSSEMQWKKIINKSSKKEDIYEKGKLHHSKKGRNSFSSANLEIDQIVPKAGYDSKNCVFACHICNNSKSDFIETSDYKDYFGDAVKKFIDYLENN